MAVYDTYGIQIEDDYMTERDRHRWDDCAADELTERAEPTWPVSDVGLDDVPECDGEGW